LGLGRVRPYARRLSVGPGSFFEPARLLVRNPQVEPALEMVRRGLHKLGAELGGRLQIARRQRRRRLGVRPHHQELFRRLPYASRVLARHVHRNQIHHAIFGLGIPLEYPAVQRSGFV